MASARQFINLLVDEPVPQREQAVRAALTGLALFNTGDASALVPLQRAYALGGPGGPIQFLIGAVQASQGREAEAITAWLSAKDEGLAVTAPFLLDAYLRRGDKARASALAAADLAGQSGEGASRGVAAAHLANGRDQEALSLLEARLSGMPGDTDAQWLRLQGMYGLIVRGGGGDRPAFKIAAQAYIDAGGANAALATEWLKAVP